MFAYALPQRRIKMDNETIEFIMQILKKGNTAEIKREQGQLVVVEIQRKVKIKTPING